jgi:2-octaprenyl-6-methoxyphenol hydroxylase
MTDRRFEVAIVGGGPVGLALAAMLAARGVDPAQIALVDARPVERAVQDPRAIALSYGSRQLLTQVGAWPATATPITQIHVSRRGSFGRTLIDSTDFALPALGYVCRYGDVVNALSAALPPAIAHYRPASAEALQEHRDHVDLRLSTSDRLTASVVVQAEGGVFGEQGTRALQRDYSQIALIATVHASAAPPGRAFERFTDEGPLALLPQGAAYSMVWCVRPGRAEVLMALDDAAFIGALQQAFGQRVGKFLSVSARHSYSLGLNAGTVATARTIAIGNAAQTLHPVAGQGLNLGLRDAAVLASMLARECAPSSVTMFEHERQRDRSTTVRLTDVMARVFASTPEGSWLQHALGLSLGAIDVLPPAKRWLADQMMFGSR